MSDFAPGWLALREPADADARADGLVTSLRAHLPVDAPLVIRDLGCGTGSLARWLAPRLPGPQRWILYDSDPALLARAARETDGLRDGGGRLVGIETREADLTGLRAPDLRPAPSPEPEGQDPAGTVVVTGSALLDLLTAAEVDVLAAACATTGCPALFTLSVTGQVELDPPDALDADVAAAFDAHQRRAVEGTGAPARVLLGPDAPGVATDAFRRHGMTVEGAVSTWVLGPRHAELAAEWLRGRVAAAVDQRPDLAPHTGRYLDRRLAACAAGELTAEVHHHDVLALPREVPT